MARGITTSQAIAGFLSADAAGRALLAASFFDAATVLAKYAAGQLPAKSLGACMVNRLLCATGATGAAGETVTIGANVFELRADTPPTGGTAGRIWVYNGGGGGVLATIRTNLIDAINGVVDTNRIEYDGALTETFLAALQGAGTIELISADAAGGTPVASAVATACSETLADALDVWDQATCYGGRAAAQQVGYAAPVALTAQHIARGDLRIPFPFTPVGALLFNRTRPAHNEAWTVTADEVILTLTGGVPPNCQVADVIDVIAWA